MFAFVLTVRNLLLSVVVHGKCEGDEAGADDVGINPHRDPVVGAPVFTGKCAGGTHVVLTPRSPSGVRRGGNGAEPQRMLALARLNIGQSHLSLAAEGPVSKILHAVEQTRSQHLLRQPAIVRPVFVPRLHRHGRRFLSAKCRPGGQKRKNKKAGYSMHSNSPYEAARAGGNSVFPCGPWNVKRDDSATPSSVPATPECKANSRARPSAAAAPRRRECAT